MHSQALQIVSYGAATTVGRSALASAAAVRAGISGFSDHPFMFDTSGKPMKVARAPWLDGQMQWEDRITALLFMAIDESLQKLNGHPLKLGLSVALPAPRPGITGSFEATLRGRIARQYGGAFSGCACFPAGHAGGSAAIQAAASKMSEGKFDACLIAGVDSYLDPEMLEWLEDTDQLHGAGRLNNAWGFVPGEAAGAVCLMRPSTQGRLGMSVAAEILAVSGARETKLIRTDAVCIGEGLTRAFRAALQALPPGRRVSDVYCDMNGDPYRADEYGFACLRTGGCFEDPAQFVAPADCWGDVAAASLPLLLTLSVIASQKGYAKGDLALVWSGSDGGDRAAVLVGAAGCN